MTDLPLNKMLYMSRMSLRVLSKASKHCRAFIRAFILNYQALRPDGRSNEAIPDDATTKTILSSERSALMIVFQSKCVKNTESLKPEDWTALDYALITRREQRATPKQCLRKVADGHFTAAVKVLSSSGVASYCDDTIKALEAKRPYKPPPSMPSITFSEPPLVAEIDSVFSYI
ncbi:hypothetical protein Tco_1387574 [Tanacetum coccineum]